MTNQDLKIIIQAIQERKSISFEYNKPDKIIGTRVGNPYVIYSDETETCRYLDLYQTNGVSDSQFETLHWVTLDTDFIANVVLQDTTFHPIEDYRRYAKRFMIAYIKI